MLRRRANAGAFQRSGKLRGLQARTRLCCRSSPMPDSIPARSSRDGFRPPHATHFHRIMCDKDSNKPKGYGFADYMDPTFMDTAVRLLNGREVHSRPIRVDYADHSDKERIRGVCAFC